MRSLMLLVTMLAVGVGVGVSAPGSAVADTIIVFVDGSRMEIQSYEVKEGIVLFTTKEGKLRSVPRSYVNLVATEQANRGGKTKGAPPAASAQTAPAKASPAPAPPKAPAPTAPKPREMPTEKVEPEPPVKTVPVPTPTPAPPAPPSPAQPPAAASPTPVSPANGPAIPPPVWSNDELQVSLVVPSAQWKIDEIPASFDVAVTLENASTEAKATLALIRQKIRGKKDFAKAVRDVESSIAQAPGYRAIENAELSLEPYTAHEFRFVKNAGFVPIFNRLVVFYSRDLAYVLSLTCPESRREENAADFEALVRGLVIKKSRKELSF